MDAPRSRIRCVTHASSTHACCRPYLPNILACKSAPAHPAEKPALFRCLLLGYGQNQTVGSSSSHPHQLHTSQVGWDRKCQTFQKKLCFWQSSSSNNDGPLSVEYQAGKKDKGGEKGGLDAAPDPFSCPLPLNKIVGDTDGAVLLLQGQGKGIAGLQEDWKVGRR